MTPTEETVQFICRLEVKVNKQKYTTCTYKTIKQCQNNISMHSDNQDHSNKKQEIYNKGK